MTTQAAMTVRGLSKSFAGKPVLDEINLELKPGQVVALLGASGAGKSTLLKCLNLMESADMGLLRVASSSWICGAKKQALKKSQWCQQVGMVFQQYHLWPHKTVLQNLMLAPKRIHKKTTFQLMKQAMTILKQLGISDKAQVYPADLSGGQQQRVAIARALMMNPDVLLFDEPTAALDQNTVKQVANIIKSLAAKGKAIVIATHELDFAKQAANEVVLLSNGTIVEKNNVQDFFYAPKSNELKEYLDIK